MPHVTVRYWASARQAAGVDSETLEFDDPVSLADVIAECVRRHSDPRLPRILECCSVLIGDRPATADPATTMVPDGAQLEFLPPFAGG